jgi:hypothetical protein
MCVSVREIGDQTVADLLGQAGRGLVEVTEALVEVGDLGGCRADHLHEEVGGVDRETSGLGDAGSVAGHD